MIFNTMYVLRKVITTGTQTTSKPGSHLMLFVLDQARKQSNASLHSYGESYF